MKAQELESIFQQNKWSGWDYTEDKSEYIPPQKIRYALVASLRDDAIHGPNIFAIPGWIRDHAERKAKADERTVHQFDPAPRNKTTDQLLQDFVTKGLRVKARTALRERAPYVSFAEQQKILGTFFENASVDRLFALRYLDTHWDEYYTPFVEKAWREHHEMESARVICHHFSQSFILDNRQDLAKDYNYLQVRLRLPASFEIDREQLSDSAYLYLCARQSLPVHDDEAELMFFQNVLNSIANYYIKSTWNFNPVWSDRPKYTDNSLCDVPTVSSLVWSLGMLGKTDILLRFIDFNQKIYPLFNEEKWQEVKDEFKLLGLDLDYSKYDDSVLIREHKKYTMGQNPDFELPPDIDFDAFIEKLNNASSSQF